MNLPHVAIYYANIINIIYSWSVRASSTDRYDSQRLPPGRYFHFEIGLRLARGKEREGMKREEVRVFWANDVL